MFFKVKKKKLLLRCLIEKQEKKKIWRLPVNNWKDKNPQKKIIKKKMKMKLIKF